MQIKSLPEPSSPRVVKPSPRINGGQLLRVGVLVAAALLLRGPLKLDPANAGGAAPPQMSQGR